MSLLFNIQNIWSTYSDVLMEIWLVDWLIDLVAHSNNFLYYLVTFFFLFLSFRLLTSPLFDILNGDVCTLSTFFDTLNAFYWKDWCTFILNAYFYLLQSIFTLRYCYFYSSKWSEYFFDHWIFRTCDNGLFQYVKTLFEDITFVHCDIKMHK